MVATARLPILRCGIFLISRWKRGADYNVFMGEARMNIDKLEAGRELDALVAEQLFGWQWALFDQGFTKEVTRTLVPPDSDMLETPASGQEQVSRYYYCHSPHYSNDIAATESVIMVVLASLAQPGPRGGFRSGNVTLAKGAWIRHIHSIDIHQGRWICKFIQEYSGKQKRWWGFADKLPLAICRAALKVPLEPKN